MIEQPKQDNVTTPPAAKPTEREAQRAALRALVLLSSECTKDEAAIEETHNNEVVAEDKDYERGTWAAEQRAKGLDDGIKAKYQERVGRIDSQYASETGSIRQADQKGKQAIQAEHGPVEVRIKKQFDEAIWLADAELEARQAQLRVEQHKAKEDQKSQGEETDAIEGKAQEVLKLFGHKLGDVEPVTDVPATEEGNFTAKRDATIAQLAVLEQLSLPKLFVGSRPYLLLIVLVIAAAAGTQFHFNTIEPQVNALAVVCGATFVGLLAIGIALRVMAKGKTRTAWTQVRRALDDTRKATKFDYEAKLKELGERAQHAKEKRATEALAAKEKFTPLLQRVKEKRAAALAVLEEQRLSQIKQYDDKRMKLTAENEAWQTKHLADSADKLLKEIEAINLKHDNKVIDIAQRYKDKRAALEKHWTDGLADIARPMENTSAGQSIIDWEHTDWEKWRTPREFAKLVRFGELQVDLKQITDQVPQQLALPKAFSVPANLAFPKQSSLLIHADRDGRPEAITTLQMVMARLLTSMPAGRCKFTIIDPVGLGQNFAGFMHLADHDESLVGSRIWTEREHIEQRLLNLTEHMETVIQKYLRNEYETIDQYNAQAGELAEPYRFMVIADFPVGFEGDSFRRLSSIASTGARCGVYTLVIRDTRVPLPQGAHFDELEGHSVNLVRQDGKYVWKDEVFKQFPLKLDLPPEEGLLTQIMDVVGKYAKDANRVEVPFEQIAPKESEYWTESARSMLQVPIGRMGATRVQSLRFGKGVAQHALVAGKTGSGKSTLLHAIIANIAMWYRPSEVELYLIDFKKGVEFKTYANHQLPHARAIAVESDREFGLSVLQRLDSELSRRGEIFRKLSVQDLASYRDEPDQPPMPRTLLIIDEFQEFFSEDDRLAQDASVLIDRLVRQGRAFGIHVFLGSQTIGGTSGLSRSTIGQMAVRIALQTSEADSQLILGDGNSAARLLSRPGEAIYNDAGGLVEGNSPFQVAWLPDAQRDVFLARVLAKAKAENAFYGEPAVVFEGNAPADIFKNNKLLKVLNDPRLREMPTTPLAWLGEPVAIKDPTGINMRRQSGSNILIVGQQDELALALLQSCVISLAGQHTSSSAKFYLMDGTPADSSLAGILDKLKDIVPQELNIVDYRDVPDVINELAKEQARRQTNEDPNAQAIYVIIYGLQRYRSLRKQEENFSFGSSGDEEKKPQADKQFADLLREGPSLGIHVISWCDTPASVERTLDRGSMREFDNRILFQMSANDSSNLIDSPAANKLGFFRALAYSEEQGVMEKFRPYALATPEWMQLVRSKLRP